MPVAKPSLDLVRSATDDLVLRTLIRHRRLTRAELAVTAGISKPTASESVRRLAEVGLLSDTGQRTSGRGRVGSYYALVEDVGTALVVSVAPEGVVAECVDVYGDVLARAERAVHRPARLQRVADAIRVVARAVGRETHGPARLAVVSAADPVDRVSGRLVHLPDAPFLVGELDPVRELADLVAGGPVIVDNDVNWAARAERAASVEAGTPLDDFAYLFLGEGLGCAIVSDGEVRRGHTGLAGEIAHLLTVGPAGEAVPLTGVFEALGLRRPRSTAVDVDALVAALTNPDPAGGVRTAIGGAVAGVLAALVALTDPQTVVLGGPWGAHPAVIDAVEAQARHLVRPVGVRRATVVDAPSLTGARRHALVSLQADIIQKKRRDG